MASLVAGFPFFVAVTVIVLLVLALRLDRRMSRGASSAGDLEPERPAPIGLTETPWEIKAIDDQLRAMTVRSSAVRRHDLTATVNRLVTAAGLPVEHQLPLDADQNELASAIAAIERQLDLPPLPRGPDGQ